MSCPLSESVMCTSILYNSLVSEVVIRLRYHITNEVSPAHPPAPVSHVSALPLSSSALPSADLTQPVMIVNAPLHYLYLSPPT